MEEVRGAPVAGAGNTGPVIRLRGVKKVFQTGRVGYPALRGVDLEVSPGELVAVVGPSGSGKSTILNIITGIDRPTAGEVTVTGRDLVELSEEELAIWRGNHVGIVFQFFQLLPTLTAAENVMLPLDFARTGTVPERADRAQVRLEQVGLGDKLSSFPAELSGGEQQRVAIARALACDPAILVADEPTGNLDSDTALEMFDVFGKVNVDGTTIVYVTHDPGLAGEAHRVVTIRDGRVVDGSRS
ncbi:MAG: ABC transporter ATP-binding protein [Acidimicrobiia bacterium]|nr:ABC transporter ATP-binding protein [Acidimicrobiia bacterium]